MRKIELLSRRERLLQLNRAHYANVCSGPWATQREINTQKTQRDAKTLKRTKNQNIPVSIRNIISGSVVRVSWMCICMYLFYVLSRADYSEIYLFHSKLCAVQHDTVQMVYLLRRIHFSCLGHISPHNATGSISWISSLVRMPNSVFW